MKYKDLVILKSDKPEFSDLKKNKKLAGAIVSEVPDNGKWKVTFINEEGKLVFCDYLSEDDLEVWQHPDIGKELSCDGEMIPNYTLVELANDRSSYNKQGIYKGMKGIVIEIWENGGYEVDFSNNEGKQIFCAVVGNDLKIIEK